VKIEPGTAAGVTPYYTVLVDANELVVASGKRLPYSTWIGTIRLREGRPPKITLWTPAASVPRGYKEAAQEMLERAAEQLVREQARDLSPREIERDVLATVRAGQRY
jgi:uncharacterized protein YbdZ (MbtH family)